MDGIVGTEWDFEVVVAEKIVLFGYYGDIIGECDPFIKGGKCSVICGWYEKLWDKHVLSFVRNS